jgi:hypothetical protein
MALRPLVVLSASPFAFALSDLLSAETSAISPIISRFSIGNLPPVNRGLGWVGKPCVSVSSRYSTGKSGFAFSCTFAPCSFIRL